MEGVRKNAFMLLVSGKVQEVILLLAKENAHVILSDYAAGRTMSDLPDFVEQLCKTGYRLRDRDHFDSCMYNFYETRKPKSARKLLEFYPHSFDHDLFDNMCTDACVEGMVHMIDMGMQLDWVTTEDIPETALTFHFARNRARKRAIILLGFPPATRAGTRTYSKSLFESFGLCVDSIKTFHLSNP